MFFGCYLAEAGYTALAYNGVHSGESFRTSEFEVAVEEVDAAIAFVQARGFKNIVLAGHRLGTPIVENYQGDKPSALVKALGVYGPHSDIPSVTKDSLLGPDLYEKFTAQCRRLVSSGQRRRDQTPAISRRQSDHHLRQDISQLAPCRDQQSGGGKDGCKYHGPLLIVYDGADNIQGKGSITRRETIATRIRENAIDCPTADIVVPSHPGNSPFQAHLFVNNERTVTQETVNWLTSVGLAPARVR